MKVFTTNYHISVNPTLVDDLLACGHEVIMPSKDFANTNGKMNNGRIWFFAPNDEHASKPGVQIVEFDDFLKMEPMAILTPCMQHIDDFHRLWGNRKRVDQMVYLTANSSALDFYPDDAEFVMSHDLYYHRKTDAPYKIWYFNQPKFKVEPKDEDFLRRTFEERKIKLYVNNFYEEGFEPELQAANDFREQWKNATGYEIPFYGYGNPDGWPQPPVTHEHMVDSMFTLCFKRRETWGQMVNESMQLGTPCIFLREFLYSTFTEYLITPDVAIVDETVNALIDRILNLTFEQYETLVREAQWQSRMFCNDEIRREKVSWLFDKVESKLKEGVNV